jgi:uncharacterized repeat protein (TIGR03803 family)
MGNIYGSTAGAGTNGGGTAFEMMNLMNMWSLNTLYSFTAGGGGPSATLTMDAAGDLYGTTAADGAFGKGSVFKLANSGSGWTYTSLHDFTGGSDGAYPSSNVVFDPTGRLYGTASMGGDFDGTLCSSGGCGVVWEIAP